MPRTRRSNAARTRRAPQKPGLPSRLSITQARHDLCPLVKDLSARADGVVGIMVGEEVGAYLVSPERMEQLEEAQRRLSLRGPATLEGGIELLTDDLEGALAEARRELEREVAASADRVMASIEGEDA